MRDRSLALWFTLAVGVLLALLPISSVRAAESYNFAGSAQLDYHLVPDAPRATLPPNSRTSFQGFTMEAGLKVAVDISDHLSANVKACYGCHGLEVDMAYFDFRAFDELNLRVGRFSPTFGAFNLRHDPANHMLSDKPLPYDMGRMLRRGDWNNGVLPAPFPTNGVELNGTHWFGSAAQLDFAAYAVTALKNTSDPNPTDLNFQESHLPYYVDSAVRPAAGARLALTFKASAAVDVTLGASGMYGSYDLRGKLSYAIGGADFSVHVQRTAFRAEYLVRRQEFDTRNPDVFKYTVVDGGDFFVKHGAFAELEQPFGSALACSARVDGMFRQGNVSNVPVGSGSTFATATNPLGERASVLRETLGLAYALERNLRLKASAELWQFSYADEQGSKTALGFHLGAVGSF